jgi:hydrophobic/amphiphilic exporter-1 (mainly G- bacteria), HAE1 family
VIRAEPNGAFVRVKDVGRVELGAQNYSQTSRFNGKPTAALAIYQLPGSNAVNAAKGVRELMKRLKEKFPSGLDYSVSLDTTLAVTAGMEEIYKTLVEAMILVIIVVFIFLQGWRATLIPLFAVPVSLVGTFAVFPLLGFSVNTLSLLGLVLAIGLVVDDAIVVVEAVEHHIEHGLSPKEATLKAMEEVSGPVIAIALILAAVFIPTAFIPGITGRLYQQFAVTIAVSVIFSAFNALTLSPALSALLLRPKKEGRGPLALFFKGFNNVFGSATNGYIRVCRVLMRRGLLCLLFLVLVLFTTGWLGGKIPQRFRSDSGAFLCGRLPDLRAGRGSRTVCVVQTRHI